MNIFKKYAIVILAFLMLFSMLSCDKNAEETTSTTDAVSFEKEESQETTSVTEVLDTNFTPVCVDGKWGYENSSGKLVIDTKFEEAYEFCNNDIALVKIDGLYGFIDKTGAYSLQPEFSLDRDFNKEGIAVIKKDYKYGFIGKDGTFIEPQYTEVGEFASNGLATITLPFRKTYIDAEGNEAFDSQYYGLGNMAANGLVSFSQNGKWGFINEKGEVVIEPIFEETPAPWTIAPNFNDGGTAFLYYEGEPVVIDETGKIINHLSGIKNYDDFSNGLYEYRYTDGPSGISDSYGNVIFEPQFDYGSVDFGENGIGVAAKTKYQNGYYFRDKFCFIDTKGNILFDGKTYNNAKVFSNGYAAVKTEDGWGYINETGEMVIQPNPSFEKYSGAGTFSSVGLACVNIDGKYGYINTSGELVIEAKFETAYDFASNGLAAVSENSYYDDSSVFGYINTSGEYVIEPQFDSAGKFGDNGLAIARKNRQYGYINESGEYVIGPGLIDAEGFNEKGLALVEVGGSGYINTKGEIVIEPQFVTAAKFDDEGMARVSTGNRHGGTYVSGDWKYGFINSNGEFVITPSFYSATDFDEYGLSYVHHLDEMTNNYIDRQGNYIIDFEYNVKEFTENGLAACVYNEWSYSEGEGLPSGYINRNGEMVIETNYKSVESFSEGRAAVSDGDNYGFIDETGKLVIDLKYQWVRPFRNGLADVRIRQYGELKHGYINSNGETVIDFDFTDATCFNKNGLAIVTVGSYPNSRCGIINSTGAYVVEPKYSMIEDVYTNHQPGFTEEGIAIISTGNYPNELYGYISATGEVLIEPMYDDLRHFAENGLAVFALNGKYGFMNESFEYVIQPQFEKAENFSENGLAVIKKNGKYGFINESGEIVIEPQFDTAYSFNNNNKGRWTATVSIDEIYFAIDETGAQIK